MGPQIPLLPHILAFLIPCDQCPSCRISDLVSCPLSCWKGDISYKYSSWPYGKLNPSIKAGDTRASGRAFSVPLRKQGRLSQFLLLYPLLAVHHVLGLHQAVLKPILVNLQSSHVQTDTVAHLFHYRKELRLNNVIKRLGCSVTQV